jgi:hypothetical protein
MSRVTIARTAVLAVLLATFAVGSDKTPHPYQKGTIKGWDKRTDVWGSAGANGDDNGKEYRCKIEGKKVLEGAMSGALPAKP